MCRAQRAITRRTAAWTLTLTRTRTRTRTRTPTQTLTLAATPRPPASRPARRPASYALLLTRQYPDAKPNPDPNTNPNQAHRSMDLCDPCEVGMFQPITGQRSCVACARGSFQVTLTFNLTPKPQNPKTPKPLDLEYENECGRINIYV